MNLGTVILAAGSSRRMGRPKLLLPWGDTSVLGHQIRLWQQLGAAQVCVVYSPTNEAIRAELDRLGLAAGNRIADYHAIWNGIQVRGVKAGTWTNYAFMISNLFQGTAVAVFGGQVTK